MVVITNKNTCVPPFHSPILQSIHLHHHHLQKVFSRVCFTNSILSASVLVAGESRSAASPSSSGEQKGCGLATMSHSTTAGRNNTRSPSTMPQQTSSTGGAAMANALNGHPGLSFLTSQMAMSANKLLQLAQKHQQQQQNYSPLAQPNIGMHGASVKREHLESAVALLSDRLSPTGHNSSISTNNNSFSVNNLNLEKLTHRMNGHSATEEASYLPKNLTAKDFNSSSNHRVSPQPQQQATIKSERNSPASFNHGKAANGRSSAAAATGTGNGAGAGRSRSSTPSSSSVVFNSSSSSNNGNSNGLLGLNGNGTGQHQQQFRNGSSASLSELSLSRTSHHQLSNHHPPTTYGQQSAESRTQENLRQGEPQARNYSDMIRSLAAKYNSSNNE